jgi:hypothetical protein
VSGDIYEIILKAYRDAGNKLMELSERTASLHPGALVANRSSNGAVGIT